MFVKAKGQNYVDNIKINKIFMFKDKVVIVTGGANGIGRCIANEFRSMGAIVYEIDKQEGNHFV